MLTGGIIPYFSHWLKFICSLIATVLLIITTPIFVVITLPIYTFRWILVKLARIFRPDLGKIISARSATFAADDLYGKPKANLMSFVSVRRENGRSLEEMRRDFMDGTIRGKETGELANPEFQQYVSSWLGFPFWKWDNDFNIENHIVEYDGARPVPTLTKDILNELCSEYLKTPFIRGRSPWKVIIFPKCKFNSAEDEETTVGIITLLHHCLADGFSAINTFCSSVTPGKELTRAKPKPVERNIMQAALFNLSLGFRIPFEFVSALIYGFDVNGLHIPEAKLSNNIMLGFSERIPISLIKSIKKSHDVTFSAVLLAVFAGAVRKFFIQNDIKVPSVVHAAMPVPVLKHSTKLRNIMSACFVELPVGLPTPELRLQKINKNLKELKKSTQPLTAYYLIPVIGGLPTWMGRVLVKQICPTVLISNFPGPQDEVRVMGCLVQDCTFTAGLLPGNIGIGFDAISYNGNVRLQAAFNEAVARTQFSRTILLDNVMHELQMLAEKQLI